MLLCGCEEQGASADHEHGADRHDHAASSGGPSMPGTAAHMHASDAVAMFQDQAAALHDHAVEHDHDAIPSLPAHSPDDFPTIESLPGGWTAIEPGGDTLCARGDRFRFFVRPGTVNRVVLEFRGGGACWDESTCAPDAQVFTETADLDLFVADEAQAQGLRDHTDARNPFRDWHHVFVPYCTGDQHWGNVTRTYDSGEGSVTIHHNGAINTRAVLDWMYRAVPAPQKAFVTGCSAGAMGSILWSAYVRDHYRDARVYQFGDSNSGVLPPSHAEQHADHGVWQERGSFPPFIEAPADASSSMGLYGSIGNHFDDLRVSQFTSNYDYVQWLYYVLGGGGDVQEWSAGMRTIVAEIQATTPRYRSFIGPGAEHCVIPDPGFYTAEAGGVRLLDWLTDLVEDRPVENITCGDDCGMPKMPAPSGS